MVAQPGLRLTPPSTAVAGPATAYSIGTDGSTVDTVLWRSIPITGSMDPGRTVGATEPRDRGFYLGLTKRANTERQRVGTVLKSINQAHQRDGEL